MKRILHLLLFNYCLISGQFSFSQCVEGDCNNGYGIYKWESGSKYEGNWVNGSRTGKGKYTWNDGSNYDGEFIMNKHWGYGRCEWQSGDIYEGNFLNNIMHGFGTMIYANGEIYEGNWVSGMRTGKGKQTLKDGEIKEGNFVNGELFNFHSPNLENSTLCISGNCIDGIGIYKWPEGNVYVGEFKNGAIWGYGEKTFTSGLKYYGEWINNEMTGTGIYYFTNGDKYEGEFVKDKITGFGVLTRANGDRSTGYFVENKIIMLTDKQIANNTQSITNNNNQNETKTNKNLERTSLGNVSSTNSIAKDADGKVYKSVIIGNQSWMAENLNTSKFRNGDPIPEVKTDEEWAKALKEGRPAWSYYDNDQKKGAKYGKLYNWYAVNDPRGLAPIGWHIPTDNEWTALTDYLGGEGGYTRNKLKAQEKIVTEITYVEIGGYDEKKWVACSNCSYWTEKQKANNPCAVCRNTGGKYVKTGKYIPKKKEKREEDVNAGWNGSNESGFSALAGGERYVNGHFEDGFDDNCRGCGAAYFWTSTKDGNSSYWYRIIDNESVSRRSNYVGGLSVRCIKD
jgi:uncharacterized protein (TIGR02145 family)